MPVIRITTADYFPTTPLPLFSSIPREGMVDYIYRHPHQLAHVHCFNRLYLFYYDIY